MARYPTVVLADLDGTIISRGQNHTDECRDLIREVATHGGTVIPVSARPVPLLARMFADLHEVALVVGSGGAVVSRVHAGDVADIVWEQGIPPGELRLIIDSLEHLQVRLGGAIFLFGCANSDFEVIVTLSDAGRCPSGEELRTIAGIRPMRITRLLRQPNGPVLGVSLLSRASVESLSELPSAVRASKMVRSTVYPEFRLDGWNWLEFLPANVNKGVASEHAIAALTNGSPVRPHIVALGDAMDDIAMFRVAAVSYCPADANPLTKQAASLVVDRIGGRDFAEAIRELLLAPNDGPDLSTP